VRSSETSRDQSAKAAAVDSRRNAWALLLAGLMLGLVGMHLTAVKPLRQQMDVLQRELAGVQGELRRIAAARPPVEAVDGAVETLVSQRRQMDEARRSAEAVRRLCAQIERGGRECRSAFRALDDLAEMHDALIVRRDQILAAEKALDGIERLQKRLADLKASLEQDTHDVDMAAARVDQLLTLKDQVVWRGGNTMAARETVDRLLMLRDGLTAETIDVATAGNNLEMLLTLQNKLTRRSLSDARVPRESSTPLLDGMLLTDPLAGASRIAEAAAWSCTAARAARAFEPILEIAGIGPQELREAAARLLSRQFTRISLREKLAPEMKRRMPDRDAFGLPVETDTRGTAVPWPFHED
jgi:prefoldin subunit 5